MEMNRSDAPPFERFRVCMRDRGVYDGRNVRGYTLMDGPLCGTSGKEESNNCGLGEGEDATSLASASVGSAHLACTLNLRALAINRLECITAAVPFTPCESAGTSAELPSHWRWQVCVHKPRCLC